MASGERVRVVVVGAGMAGARFAGQMYATGAAQADGLDVTVVGEEPHAPYNRVLLADVLGGRYAPDVVTLPTNPARLLSGVRVVRIDRAERRVVCDDGTLLPYDVLVLATGASPVLPPLRGLFTPDGGELPGGVRAFRTMDDCLALAAEAHDGVPTVVVGGGLLGVSAARALARRGARVVLAQQGERLMERQLDPASAQLLRRHLESLGVEVHTECRVRGLHTKEYGDERTVRAVELADGYRLQARLVVLACGVRPRTGLARAAGLEVAHGVVVDDRLRTSDPHIHAIGDCAEHAGAVYGLAGPAQEQADVLARVLTGHASSGYQGTRALTRLTLPSGGAEDRRLPLDPLDPLDLAAFGDPLPRADDDVVQLADATRGVYRRVVVRGDRLAGGVLLGDLTTVGTLARAWEDDVPLPPEPLLHLLTHDGEVSR